MGKPLKTINITMKTKPERIALLFDKARRGGNPVNLKTSRGYHWAVGDLYFKMIDDETFSYQLDQQKWVGPL